MSLSSLPLTDVEWIVIYNASPTTGIENFNRPVLGLKEYWQDMP